MSLKEPLKIWKKRGLKQTLNLGYVIYALFLLCLIAVLPIARVIWIIGTGPQAFELLSSETAPSALVFFIAALWASSLFLGSKRGPALFPPFLTYAFGTSSLSKWKIYRVRLLSSALVFSISIGGLASIAAGSLAEHTLFSGIAAFVLIGSGLLAGGIGSVFFLVGQAFPKKAGYFAMLLLGLGYVCSINRDTWALIPMGWWGLIYQTTFHAPSSLYVIFSIIIFASGVLFLNPYIVNRLRYETLMKQSIRWELATVFISTMDFAGAAEVYQSQPSFGRNIHAVNEQSHLLFVFFARDFIGSIRTPGRFVSALLAFVASSLLATAASTVGVFGWLLGTIAALLAFAGLGPLTDGLRNAARVASDFPLYGLSDSRLLLYRVPYPAVVALTINGISTIAFSTALGASQSVSMALGTYICLLALSTRIISSLKGSMPLELLSPAPTPFGDFNALVRILWAFEGLIISMIVGASSLQLINGQPVVALATTGMIAVLARGRWRKRRC